MVPTHRRHSYTRLLASARPVVAAVAAHGLLRLDDDFLRGDDHRVRRHVAERGLRPHHILAGPHVAAGRAAFWERVGARSQSGGRRGLEALRRHVHRPRGDRHGGGAFHLVGHSPLGILHLRHRHHLGLGLGLGLHLCLRLRRLRRLLHLHLFGWLCDFRRTIDHLCRRLQYLSRLRLYHHVPFLRHHCRLANGREYTMLQSLRQLSSDMRDHRAYLRRSFPCRDTSDWLGFCLPTYGALYLCGPSQRR
mmetsp:Transcript_41477/g.100701  ORF Transcript_41477/g.100701 Transcript_41477/m.100701 type:complete len:249 (+) Transcript_41477:193-939(+)